MNNPFIDRIQETYPHLVINHIQPVEIGQNNDVMIINNNLVFRFPKYDEGITRLKEETAILDAVKERVPLPVPHLIYRSFDPAEPGKVFTGYPLIQGEPFWKTTFTQIEDSSVNEQLAVQLVSFLKSLHEIPLQDVPNLTHTNPQDEMRDLYEKIKQKLFVHIRSEAQKEIMGEFETFLNQSHELLKPVLIHGDFGASNILWDPVTKEISGIIDFGGSCVGDPAYDLAGLLSSYGDKFFNRCIELYPDGEAIRERVHFYRSTFALQDALHGVIHNDSEAFENGIKTYR